MLLGELSLCIYWEMSRNFFEILRAYHPQNTLSSPLRPSETPMATAFQSTSDAEHSATTRFDARIALFFSHFFADKGLTVTQKIAYNGCEMR